MTATPRDLRYWADEEADQLVVHQDGDLVVRRGGYPLNLGPPSWYVEHILPRRTMVGWIGDSQSGKSIFLLELLYHMAMDLGPWHEWRTDFPDDQYILYISTEGEHQPHMVLRGMMRKHGLTKEQLGDMRLDLTTFPFRISRDPNVMGTFTHEDGTKMDHGELLYRMMMQGNYGIVVVDTLNSVGTGVDENHASMGDVIKGWEDVVTRVSNAGRPKPTVIFVHHTTKADPGKAPTERSAGESPSTRGSGAVYNALDHVVGMVRESRQDAPDPTWFTIMKQRSGPRKGFQGGLDLAWHEEEELRDNFDNPMWAHVTDQWHEVPSATMSKGRKTETIEGRVLAFVSSHPGESKSKITKQAGGDEKANERALLEFVDRGFVTVDTTGPWDRYYLNEST